MIKDLLKSNARRYPEKTAIIFKDIRRTYKEFNDRINRLANGLVNLGLKKGDWVAIVADDCIQQVEIFWVGAKAGIATSSLNTNSSKRDFLHLIGNGKASAVICSRRYLKLVESLRPELEDVKEFIVLGPSEKGFIGYEDLISDSSSLELEVEVSEDDLLYLANTSGTTGLSKQPMHSHKTLFSTILMDLDAFNYDMSAGGSLLVAMPLFAAFILPRVSILSFYMRCPLVIPSDLAPQTLLQIIEKERVTDLFVPTAFFQPIIEHPGLHKYDYSSLRSIFIFGFWPPEIWQRAVELFGSIFVAGYGLSEIGFVSYLPPEEFIFEGPPEKVNRVKSCGREPLCVETRVVDEQGKDVQPGQVGEVIARGPHMMKGYRNAPEATEQTIRGGYIYTGDQATVDTEGYIFLVGRKKDSITTQGNMILPLEVEEVILQRPQVREVAVIGLPDEKLGEAVKAVVIKRGDDVTEEEIIALCRENLPDYAVPRSVDFVESLPTTAGTGRIQRFKLREEYIKASSGGE